MEQLVELYQRSMGRDVATITPINGCGAGGRRYYTITDVEGNKVFGVAGSNAEEDEAFYHLSRLFEKRGLQTARVYGISDDKMFYLQEYLGTTTLHDMLMQNRTGDEYNECAVDMLRRVMRELPDIQFIAAGEDTYKHCYPVASMDEMSIMFDLNYFKYCFVKLQNVEFNEVRLQHDFENLTHEIMKDMSDTFLYRDFQARNVMIYEGAPRYIDYQGGRRGPIFYDVASFVYDVPAKYNDQLRRVLIDEYITSLQRYLPISHDEFIPRLKLHTLFRGLQVLGAFGFRGLWEKKQLFIDSIPQGLHDLTMLLQDGVIDPYPELKQIATSLIAKEK